MKTVPRILFLLLMAGLCPTVPLHAGDLSVDNLTVVNNAKGVLPTSGMRHVIVEQNSADTAAQRGANLQAAYNKARNMSPSANNPITVLIPPGDYDLGTTGILLDREYVNLIGMAPARMTKRVTEGTYPNATVTQWEHTVALNSPQCGLRIYGNCNDGVVKPVVGHIQIANMIISNTKTVSINPSTGSHNETSSDPASYWPASGLDDIIIEHVYFDGHFGAGPYFITHPFSMRVGVVYGGVFRDCVAGGFAYGARSTATGHFEDCVGGWFSFGSLPLGNASGTFSFCTAFGGSFGSDAQSAAGVFRNCIVLGDVGFGGGTIASGDFDHCRGGTDCFGGMAGTASGRFSNCWGGVGSFGGHGGTLATSAILIHCEGGENSFGQFDTYSPDFNQSKSFYVPQGDLSMGTFTAVTP